MQNRVQTSVYAGTQPRAELERQRQYERERRATSTRRLYRTAAWRALRAAQLEACCNCQHPGCRRAATVVDHKVAHRGSNSLFFDPGNLQSLCKRHHDSKTARYDGGFGRARATSDGDELDGFGLV